MRPNAKGLRRASVVVTLAAVVAPCVANAADTPKADAVTLDTPFSLQAYDESWGAATLTARRDAFTGWLEQARSRGRMTLRDVALSPRLSVDLELRRHAASEGIRYRIMTEQGESWGRTSAVTWSGRVAGRPGSYVFLSATPGGMINGYVTLPVTGLEPEMFILSSGDPRELDVERPQMRVSQASKLRARGEAHDPWTCHVLEKREIESPEVAPEAADGAALPLVKIADIYVEADHDFRGLFLTNQDAADYAATIFSVGSDIYRRDLGAELRIPDGYLRVWETEPPWGTIFSFGDLGNVTDYWTSFENPLRNIDRASVHVLTNPVFGGVAASAGGLCSDFLGYEISSVYGFFPVPLRHQDPDNWDIYVVAHEQGHTFGSGHTFDYNPPIECVDGSGPDAGTIMSYCHLNAGGVANVGARFHPRVQDELRGDLYGAPCLEVIEIQLGDYDRNGVVDSLDQAAADTCLNQGWESLGCTEAFDFNADGALSVCDIDLLALAIDPAAPISDCNENALPDSCEDCNLNGLADECDIEVGTSTDCDLEGTPDDCQIASGAETDCNANAIPDTCDLDTGVLGDCDTNGIADLCEVPPFGERADCNANAVLDSCDVETGQSQDCNTNAVPDECDISATASFGSGQLGPIGDGATQTFTFTAESMATGSVTMSLTASADFEDPTEFMTVSLNGSQVGTAFLVFANDCPVTPDTATLTVSESIFNDAFVSGNGTITVELATSSEVSPTFCPLGSYATVALEYEKATTVDCDANGVPDSCDIAAGEVNDIDLDGTPDGCQGLVFVQDPLVRGESVTLTASGGEPGEVAYFIWGTRGEGEGPCPPELGGMCVDILGPVRVLGTATVGADGLATLGFDIPPGTGIDEISTQAAISRGVDGVDSVLSEPITATLLP